MFVYNYYLIHNTRVDVMVVLLIIIVSLKDVPQCRAMSIKYAFEIFDNDHLESRYLLILAASDKLA